MGVTQQTTFSNRLGVFKAPWQGIVTSQPENAIPPGAASNMCNWMIKDGELITFPRWTPIITAPNGTNVFAVDGTALTGATAGAQCSLIRGFNCYENNQAMYNTIIVSPDEDGLWLLQNNGVDWTNIPPDSGQPTFDAIADTTFPYPTQAYQNELYFSRFLDGYLWQLSLQPGVAPSLTSICNFTNPPSEGNFTAGCRYLTELASHLIMMYTNEPNDPNNLFTYPWRIRWSGTNTNSWDPNTDQSAGFEDLIDVTDEICGGVTSGRVVLVFRTNGISEMLPGAGLITFVWNHDWAAQRGIGAGFYNWCIANYGNLVGFVSHDNVYLYMTGNLTPIGAAVATKSNPNGVSLFDDLNQSQATNKPVGFFVPKLKNNFVYLFYVISIPFPNNNLGCIQWWYCIQDQTWIRRVLPNPYHTERGLNVFTGVPLI